MVKSAAIVTNEATDPTSLTDIAVAITDPTRHATNAAASTPGVSVPDADGWF